MAKLEMPDDVPVAVARRDCLKRFGVVNDIGGVSPQNACAMTETDSGFRCVWCALEYRNYRLAWKSAAAQGLVDVLSDYGKCVDVDHLLARAVARKLDLKGWFLRLHPVWAEVNRSAGAGREKSATGSRKSAREIAGRQAGDVVFAGELQFLKIIGHPVGTAASPEIMFG